MKPRAPHQATGITSTLQQTSRWHKVLMLLAAVVVFCTVYALILPALALENKTYCGIEAHQHSDACYANENLVCDKKVHKHSLACYSNPEADVESASDWEKSISEVELGDDWGANVAAIAQSQLGYSESEQNYAVDTNDEKQGYTRYGAWAGSPYEAWNTTFATFCLHYAGVSEEALPQKETPEAWAQALQNKDTDLYRSTQDYTPKAGDVVFFYQDAKASEQADDSANAQKADEEGKQTIERVGVVTEVTQATDTDPAQIKTVEGDVDGQVRNATYAADDKSIAGYGELLENPEKATQETNEVTTSAKPAAKAASKAARATSPVFTNTVNPSSSVINVFDYWVDKRDPLSCTLGNDGNSGSQQPSLLNEGINENHALKFRKNWGGAGKANEFADYNVVQGIVDNTLDQGYPKLSGKNPPLEGPNPTESLAYLFDPSYTGQANKYRKTFTDTKGLLYMQDGYYTYDSTQHYAYLNEKDKDSMAAESGDKFTLYNDWAITNDDNTISGQFYPFNPYPDNKETLATDNSMNHYFGLTLTARFMQQFGGHTSDGPSAEATKFHFSGDDDVWIFIDDVLVADLGGIHRRISTDIDFSTGSVEIYCYEDGAKKVIQTTNIKGAFQAAGRVGSASQWDNNTFADNTLHTLKFFYLERGNGDSNMSLQYNLSEAPPAAIYKVDQYGNPVPGAGFELYAANDSYVCSGDPVCTGTTDNEGKMVLRDQEGTSYSLASLKATHGDHFVLKEVSVPDGYRKVSDEIHLRIEGDGANSALVCDNTYQTGVWASPTLQVTAPNTLTLANGTSQDYFDLTAGTATGTLFAVPLKYTGSSPATEASLSDQANWAPVSGNSEDGYTVHEVGSGNFTDVAIDAAKQDANSNVFAKSSTGLMQATLQDLPGKVADYYHMQGDDKSKTKYTIGYYWTSAASLEGATSANTTRVNAEDPNNVFTRSFGANIEVPNLANRLLVQKFDDKKNLINGATFALFEANEDGTYKADSGSVDLSGMTYVADAAVSELKAGEYTYVVTPSTSTGDTTASGHTEIKANVGGSIKTIVSHEQRTTNDKVLQNTQGTCVFGIWGTNLTPGCYYLREVQAPEDYKINTEPVMVRVTEHAIFANAGTKDDGVEVARGPGYIVSPLHKVASEGDIDRTLSWIFQQLKVSGESAHFADASENNAVGWTASGSESHLTYTRNAASLGADRYLANYEPREGSTLTLSTDVGWSYNAIYQDYDYGKQQLADAHNQATYTDLKGQDISNLFSRTVYVQVTDEKETTPVDLTLQKYVQGTTTALSGAKFVLYTKEETPKFYVYDADADTTSWVQLAAGQKPEDKALATNDDGQILFYQIPDGTYCLEEVVAPEGYNLLQDSITFTVEQGKVTWPDTNFDEDTNTATVYNSAGYELPKAGGTGLTPFLAGGLLITILASFLLYRRYQQRREGAASH